MRLLFAKHALLFPRSSGHDVLTYHMMKTCRRLGHEVALATAEEPTAAAIDDLDLDMRFTLCEGSTAFSLPGTRLQKRFGSYWGVSNGRIAALAGATEHWRADAVVVVGLDALPYFPALAGVVRVWYAADEWVLHHCSQLKLGDTELRSNLRAAVTKGLYERAYRRSIDRAWVVTDSDRRAMRWIAGVRNVDVLPIGIDGDYFRPTGIAPTPNSAAFWGRLDFGPNMQALDWFCDRVWPLVQSEVPDSRFTIMGFNPGPKVKQLAQRPGIGLRPDVPDLRTEACEHAVAVLPMVSGAGMKNKLLEAAALGMPIVCTPTATLGLKGARLPIEVAAQPTAFASAIVGLWRDPNRAARGAATRDWVIKHHAWEATARKAIDALTESRRSASTQRPPAPEVDNSRGAV